MAKPEGQGRMTVFRVKRRRDEDAIDTLLLDTEALSPARQSKTARSSSMSAAGKPVKEQEAHVRVFRRVDTLSVTAQLTAEAATRLRERFVSGRTASSANHSHAPPPVSAVGDAQQRRRDLLAEHQRALSQAARYRLVSRARQRLVVSSGSTSHDGLTAKTSSGTESQLKATAEAEMLDFLRLYDVIKEDPLNLPPNVHATKGPISAQARPRRPKLPEGTLLVNNQVMVREPVPTAAAPQPLPTAETPNGEDGDYVYDLYVQETGPLGDASTTALAGTIGRTAAVVRFESFNEEFLWDDSDDEGKAADKAEYDSDQDSNAEDYFANEYPEEPDSDGGASDSEYGRDTLDPVERLRRSEGAFYGLGESFEDDMYDGLDEPFGFTGGADWRKNQFSGIGHARYPGRSTRVRAYQLPPASAYPSARQRPAAVPLVPGLGAMRLSEHDPRARSDSVENGSENDNGNNALVDDDDDDGGGSLLDMYGYTGPKSRENDMASLSRYVVDTEESDDGEPKKMTA